MRGPDGQPLSATQIDEDIQRLDLGIRQLKIQYERFFSGALKRQPLQLRQSLNKLIKQYLDTPITSYQHRFHFSSLVSRFGIMAEQWDKRLRVQEGTGSCRNYTSRRGGERLLASCRVQTSERDGKALRALYKQYVQAREARGDRKAALSFEKFIRGASSQARRLQSDSGCGEIELRLVVNDSSVQLRARPGR